MVWFEHTDLDSTFTFYSLENTRILEFKAVCLCFNSSDIFFKISKIKIILKSNISPLIG